MALNVFCRIDACRKCSASKPSSVKEVRSFPRFTVSGASIYSGIFNFQFTRNLLQYCCKVRRQLAGVAVTVSNTGFPVEIRLKSEGMLVLYVEMLCAICIYLSQYLKTWFHVQMLHAIIAACCIQ